MNAIDFVMLLYENFDLFSSLCLAIYAPLIIFFFLTFLSGCFESLELFFFRRRQIAFCMGLHNGTINGICRCHNCYYAKQCVYHVPRRSFSLWLRDLRKKKEP